MAQLFVLPEDEGSQKALAELAQVPGYPFDEQKDSVFVRQLIEEFPEFDVVEEIRQWKAWLLDNELKGKVNWRARLRTWFRNGRRYRGRRSSRKGGAVGPTRPGTAAEHGRTSDRLEDL